MSCCNSKQKGADKKKEKTVGREVTSADDLKERESGGVPRGYTPEMPY